MKKIILYATIFLILIFLAIGFIDVVKYKPTESRDVFTYSVSSIQDDFKSIGSLDSRIQDIICATSRGLIEIDSSNNINPSLSESANVSEDGLQYDFKIKSNVYWSDGTRITPKDIATFFREILTEEAEENIEGLLNVYGAKGFRGGEGSFSNDVGISTNDDTITFRLNSKNDKFIEELALPQYRVRKNVLLWENLDKNYSKLIYSGNYSILDMTSKKIVLNKNEKIDEKLVKNIEIVLDEATEVAMASFEVGQRDIVINPPKSQLARLNNEGKIITSESNDAMYLVFNSNDESMNAENRKNIYSLINKAIEEYQVKNSMFIELAEGSYFREDKQDLLKLQTRKVMSNSLSETTDLKEIALVAKADTQNREVCEYIKDWFEKNTEIDLTYTLIENSKIKSIKDVNYYDVALIHGRTSLSGQDSFYNMILDFIPDKYKEKLSQAKTKSEKLSAFSSLEDEFFNTYELLPLVFYNDNIAINRTIKNMLLDGNGNIDFNKLEKS